MSTAKTIGAMCLLLVIGAALLGTDINRIRGKVQGDRPIIYFDEQFPVVACDSTGWGADSTYVWIQADNWDPIHYGGVEYNDDFLDHPYSLARWRVFTKEGLQFLDVKFQKRYVVSESLWVAALDSSNVYGGQAGSATNQIDLSTVDLDSIKVYLADIRLPIWNGKPAAIAFTVDDANDENFDTYRDVFKEYGWRYTVAANFFTLGQEQKMTKAELITMSDEGFEFANHSMDHVPLEKYGLSWHPLFSMPSLSIYLDSERITESHPNYSDSLQYWWDYNLQTYFQQPTVVQRPEFQDATYNRVEFKSSNRDNLWLSPVNMPIDALFTTNPSTGGSYGRHKTSFFMVYNSDNANRDTLDYIFDWSSDPGTYNTRYLFAHTRGTGADDSMYVYVKYGGSGGWYSSGADATTGRQILVGVQTDSLRLYRNGTRIGDAMAIPDTQLYGSNARCRVGCRDDVISIGNCWTGDLQFLAFSHFEEIDDSLRQKAEGWLAWNYMAAGGSVLPTNHPYYRRPPGPTYSLKAISRLHNTIYGNKTLIEHLMNYGETQDFAIGNDPYRNHPGGPKRTRIFMWPGGSNGAWDAFTQTVAMMGHIGARLTGYDKADSLSGWRQLTYSPSTWHHMDPFAIGINQTIANIVDDGDTAGDHDTTQANMRSLLTTSLEQANEEQWANPLIILYWHNDQAGKDNVSEGHLRAMLDATLDAADSLWVAPMGDIIEYWRLAHGMPALPEVQYRTWQ